MSLNFSERTANCKRDKKTCKKKDQARKRWSKEYLEKVDSN